MTPVFSDGCHILIHVWWKFKLSKRSILCFHHEVYGLLIKIYVNKDKNGFYWFKSINNKGLSTQEIGPVKEENVIGKVLFSIEKKFYDSKE